MVERRAELSRQEYIRNIKFRAKQRRDEFCHTIENVVPKLKKEISDKKEILVTPEDLGKKLELRSTLPPRHPISIFWDARYCLWKDGIYVGTIRKDNKKMRIIRARDPDDKLLTIELWVERQLQKEK